MLAGIDTNKRNVLHDGLLHKETPCQRTAHTVVGTLSLTALRQKSGPGKDIHSSQGRHLSGVQMTI